MENTEKSGGTRYSSGKPGGFHHLPLLGLLEVARVGQYGAEKYAPHDWRQGQSFSTLMDCMARHYVAACDKGAWARDDESGRYHIAHLAWNALCMLRQMELAAEAGREGEEWFADDITFSRSMTAEEWQQV